MGKRHGNVITEKVHNDNDLSLPAVCLGLVRISIVACSILQDRLQTAEDSTANIWTFASFGTANFAYPWRNKFLVHPC